MAPQRRQSIAVNPTTSHPRSALSRKRSASMAPGETTSLAPRKSILKSAFTFNIKQQTGQDTVTFPLASGLAADASNENATEFTTEIHDGIGRKSISRRVSFAPQAHVRLFQANDQNTNSSGGPSSSPVPSSPAQFEDNGQSPSPVRTGPPQLSNENDYPGRKQWNSVGPSLRRESILSDHGEMSMSMEIDNPSDAPEMEDFVPGRNGMFTFDVSPEEDFDDEDDEDDEDMEVTEAIALNINRKQSLSHSQQQAAARRMSRRRSSYKSASAPRRKSVANDVANQSLEGSEANQSVESDSPMEFTVPLDTALSKPKPPSDAWLALQAIANASTNENEEQEMELTSAIDRLQRVRESLSGRDNGDGLSEQDDSFTGSEDSFDSVDAGDRTVNVTSILGGVRNLDISRQTPPPSTDEDSVQHNSQGRTSSPEGTEEVVGAEVPAPAPRISNVFSAAPPVNNVPSEPSTSVSTPALLNTLNDDRSAASASPTKVKSPGVFSKQSVPPSPRPPFITGSTLLVNQSTPRASRSPSPNPAVASPAKRPAQAATPEASQPSPAKRLKSAQGQDTPSRSSSLTRPTLSTLNKTVPKSPASATATSSTPKTTSTFRRPSGYFAQRRSLLPGTGAQIIASTISSTSTSAQENTAAKTTDSTPTAAKPAARPRASLPALSATVVKRSGESLRPPRPSALRPPVIKVNGPGDIGDIAEVDEEPQGDDLPGADPDTEDLPSISIEQFFAMTGVKFMDELTIPRRQSIHPSQLRNRRDSEPIPAASIPELVEALHISMPQLELYSWVAKDLQTWISNSKQIYQQAEIEVAEVVPLLFREFSLANDEGREALLHQLKLIKANKHSAAKEQWYNWKYQWISNLYESVDKGIEELESDKEVLDGIISQATSLLPALRQQHAQIMNELERETKEVEDVKNTDPMYIEELRGTINEQNTLLDAYRTDIAEGKVKLERLNEKLVELEAEKKENEAAIDYSQKKIHLHKSSTRTAVFRLKDELESLQILHSWRAAKVQPHILELVYSEQFCMTIPCIKYRPSLSLRKRGNNKTIRVTRLNTVNKSGKSTDKFPAYSEYVFAKSQQLASRIQAKSVKEIMHTFSDFWTACAQVRSQFSFLGIKYPLSITSDPTSGLTVSATTVFRRTKAKARISFTFDDDTLGQWPFNIQSLKSEVKVIYGTIDPQAMHAALMERLKQASAEDNHACLLDSCIEATSRYD